jgi:hypothetical protein
MVDDPVSIETAPIRDAQVKGKRTHACNESPCSQIPNAATNNAPNASPPFLGFRNAAGREKYTSAVADATDKVEKRIAWWEREGEEDETLEYRTDMMVSKTPEAIVSCESRVVLISGDEGFGNEARPAVWVIQAS